MKDRSRHSKLAPMPHSMYGERSQEHARCASFTVASVNRESLTYDSRLRSIRAVRQDHVLRDRCRPTNPRSRQNIPRLLESSLFRCPIGGYLARRKRQWSDGFSELGEGLRDRLRVLRHRRKRRTSKPPVGRPCCHDSSAAIDSLNQPAPVLAIISLRDRNQRY